MIKAYAQTIKNAKMSKEDLKNHMIKQRAADSVPVTGIFENKETPGGSLCFNFKKWPGDEYLQFELIDGEQYTLPKAVVNHITNGCNYGEYEYLSEQSGLKGIRAGANDGLGNSKDNFRIKRKVHRFGFRPTSYYEGMFEDNMNTTQQIVHVEAAPAPMLKAK